MGTLCAWPVKSPIIARSFWMVVSVGGYRPQHSLHLTQNQSLLSWSSLTHSLSLKQVKTKQKACIYPFNSIQHSNSSY